MAEAYNLSGRVALVTGAGAGPGRAVALALAGAGAAVMACDVNPTKADATAESIRQDGGRALGWPVDVGNKFQVASAIERLRDEFGGLHIVVSTWWVNKQQPLLTLDEYDWRRVVEVNLTGPFLVSQLAARVMADEGGGVVVLVGGPVIGSVTRQAPYMVSQVGLAALAEAMVVELAPQGVQTAYVAARDDDAGTASAVLRAAAGQVPGGQR